MSPHEPWAGNRPGRRQPLNCPDFAPEFGRLALRGPPLVIAHATLHKCRSFSVCPQALPILQPRLIRTLVWAPIKCSGVIPAIPLRADPHSHWARTPNCAALRLCGHTCRIEAAGMADSVPSRPILGVGLPKPHHRYGFPKVICKGVAVCIQRISNRVTTARKLRVAPASKRSAQWTE